MVPQPSELDLSELIVASATCLHRGDELIDFDELPVTVGLLVLALVGDHVDYFGRRLLHTRGWRRTCTQPSTTRSSPSTV